MFNLRINNNNIIVSHFTITEDNVKTYIKSDVASSSLSILTLNNTGLSQNNLLLIGNFGEETAEIRRVNSISGIDTIGLTLATSFDHYVDTPIYKIDYDQVEFSRATTIGGVKAVLATRNIQADQLETSYTDLTNTTGYAFVRYKNSFTGTFSAYSDPIPYTGNTDNSVEKIVNRAMNVTGNTLNDDYCDENQLIEDVNECQDYITSQRNWTFEIISDDTSISTLENVNSYDLDNLSFTLKYPKNKQGIIRIKFGNNPLVYIDNNAMEDLYKDTSSSPLAALINIGDTSITLVDSNSFDDAGTIYLGSNGAVAYTANDKTTGILSGISAADITAIVPSGTIVWQNVQPNLPQRYTISEGNLILDFPVYTDYAGNKLKVKALKKLTSVSTFTSQTEIPFYSIMYLYVAYKIELRKQNQDTANSYLSDFNSKLLPYVSIYKLQSTDIYQYYTLNNTDKIIEKDITD